MANPAGTWSPDGSRLVSMEIRGGFDTEGPGFELEQPELKGLGGFYTKVIVVVDVATEEPTIVAYGRSAIWVDDHTILVEV
jgi:hypothetical protein